jgi:integrase/recombinase XerD
MKALQVNSVHYRYIERSFKEWLETLGYAETTVYNMPNHIRGLLHWLEQKGKTQVNEITAEQIRQYYHTHLKNRCNFRKGGALSAAHLNKNLQALYMLCNYLRQSGRLIMEPLNISWEEKDQETIQVLMEEEIKQLYEVCDKHPISAPTKPQWFYPALALRDKAMLTVYYGCGLRRNEGLHLDIQDVLFDKHLLYVKKGKGYKERFVPISKAGLIHMERYIYDSRPLFLHDEKEDALFISEWGKPIKGQTMLVRLHTLLKRTDNSELIEKEITLHTLRHSIATHLLANGMQLEKIQEFLGHSSLESTQIYTHLLKANGYEYEDAY